MFTCRNLLLNPFQHVLIRPTSCMGKLNSLRTSKDTQEPSELLAFLKPTETADVSLYCRSALVLLPFIVWWMQNTWSTLHETSKSIPM